MIFLQDFNVLKVGILTGYRASDNAVDPGTSFDPFRRAAFFRTA
jgi:hypothetical protein